MAKSEGLSLSPLLWNWFCSRFVWRLESFLRLYSLVFLVFFVSSSAKISWFLLNFLWLFIFALSINFRYLTSLQQNLPWQRSMLTNRVMRIVRVVICMKCYSVKSFCLLYCWILKPSIILFNKLTQELKIGRK